MTAWTDHVHAYAKKNNIKYPDALKDPKCKEEYHKKKAKATKTPRKKTCKKTDVVVEVEQEVV